MDRVREEARDREGETNGQGGSVGGYWLEFPEMVSKGNSIFHFISLLPLLNF